MDEWDDGYASSTPWYEWLDQWHEDYPKPQDNGKNKVKRSKAKVALFAGTFVMLCIIILGLTWILIPSLKAGGDSTPPTNPISESEGSTQNVPAEPQTSVKEADTSIKSKPLMCEEKSGGGKLVTGKGATITSPETLIAEFQHRYFDLRDGAAVAELWDDGYTADGFQTTIDQSLKDVTDVKWCVTIMPGSKGWWVTEVKWWEPGDANPRETWLGNYKIEKRNSNKNKPDASEYVFTDVATR